MIKKKVYNKDRRAMVLLWKGPQEMQITDLSFEKSEVTDARLTVCKICKSELYVFYSFQLLLHPKTGGCPKWESGVEENVDGRIHYAMGPIQMSDLEPYVYKWRFQK